MREYKHQAQFYTVLLFFQCWIYVPRTIGTWFSCSFSSLILNRRYFVSYLTSAVLSLSFTSPEIRAHIHIHCTLSSLLFLFKLIPFYPGVVFLWIVWLIPFVRREAISLESYLHGKKYFPRAFHVTSVSALSYIISFPL